MHILIIPVHSILSTNAVAIVPIVRVENILVDKGISAPQLLLVRKDVLVNLTHIFGLTVLLFHSVDEGLERRRSYSSVTVVAQVEVFSESS